MNAKIICLEFVFFGRVKEKSHFSDSESPKKPSVQKPEHIGIAIRDKEAAVKLYSVLFKTKPYKYETVASEGVETIFYQVGPTKIELLHALSADSPIGKFLDKKGEGLHHVAFEVNDIFAEMERLKQEGFTLLSETPKYGADNKLICFIHPKSAGGVLIELCQEIKS